MRFVFSVDLVGKSFNWPVLDQKRLFSTEPGFILASLVSLHKDARNVNITKCQNKCVKTLIRVFNEIKNY